VRILEDEDKHSYLSRSSIGGDFNKKDLYLNVDEQTPFKNSYERSPSARESKQKAEIVIQFDQEDQPIIIN